MHHHAGGIDRAAQVGLHGPVGPRDGPLRHLGCCQFGWVQWVMALPNVCPQRFQGLLDGAHQHLARKMLNGG